MEILTAVCSALVKYWNQRPSVSLWPPGGFYTLGQCMIGRFQMAGVCGTFFKWERETCMKVQAVLRQVILGGWRMSHLETDSQCSQSPLESSQVPPEIACPPGRLIPRVRVFSATHGAPSLNSQRGKRPSRLLPRGLPRTVLSSGLTCTLWPWKDWGPAGGGESWDKAWGGFEGPLACKVGGWTWWDILRWSAVQGVLPPRSGAGRNQKAAQDTHLRRHCSQG